MWILVLFFLTLYFGLGYLAYRKLKKILHFYNNTYPHLENLPEQWQGFLRQDKHQWNQKQILYGSFVRFPIKILLFIQYILGCFVIIIITIPFGSHTCNKLLKYYGRKYGSFLYKLIWTINQPAGINNKIIKTPIVISNHVCWIDTMYLIVTFYPISFLSKAQVSRVPIAGRITTNAQSIYIQRNNQNARVKIVADISQRVKKFLQMAKSELYEQVYPLIIFPQGTTSNGQSLLKFKLGAFNDLASMTIVSLKYSCTLQNNQGDNFDVGMVEVTQLQHFLLSFCLKIKLDVGIKEISPNENQTPQNYCLRAQKQLSQMTGFKIYNSGFRERIEHKKLVDEKLEQTKKEKSQ